MREYVNQIDDKLIKEVLTQEEFTHLKKMTKVYTELGSEIQTEERILKKKLEGRVIGKLEGIEFCYLALGDSFFIRYVEKDKNQNTKKWWRFWK